MSSAPIMSRSNPPLMPLQIEQIILRVLEMPLLKPFETSAARTVVKRFVLVEAQAEGMSGYGECVAKHVPYYSEETVETAWHILKDFAAPALLKEPVEDPQLLSVSFRQIKGNRMAKAGLEEAVWDLFAKREGVPLGRFIGGDKEKVPVGVSLGIPRALEDLLADVSAYLKEGYQRIKVKIKPGWDVPVLEAIRREFGAIPLTVDANAAYDLNDMDLLKALDQFDLIYIEEPLSRENLWDYSELQKALKTPICLDETIKSVDDAVQALKLDACRVINVKVGRVGGIDQVLQIHCMAQEAGIPLWCGGMLESGVGRAINLALASLPGFVYPGDTSASDRYYKWDIVNPPATLNPDGTVDVPAGPGIGVRLDQEMVKHYTVREEVLTSSRVSSK